jgi:opacity protein-like surface antigen
MSTSSSFIRKSAYLAAFSLLLASPTLFAQSSSSADGADQVSSSSSLPANLDFRTQYQNQYPSGGGYHQYKGGENAFSHIAIEAGVGFASPVGNSTSTNSTGYGFLAGAGYNFNKHFGTMLEYRFDDLGISNSVLNTLNSEVATEYGINGNTHEWSFTLDPVYNLKTSGHWGGYVTGGGGFYRLLTSFNTPVDEGEECSFYYGCYEAYGNALVDHFSSNQGGLNVGGGVTWKPNPDQHGGLFADVRYEWLDSPGNSTQVIPVTFGYRW